MHSDIEKNTILALPLATLVTHLSSEEDRIRYEKVIAKSQAIQKKIDRLRYRREKFLCKQVTTQERTNCQMKATKTVGATVTTPQKKIQAILNQTSVVESDNEDIHAHLLEKSKRLRELIENHGRLIAKSPVTCQKTFQETIPTTSLDVSNGPLLRPHMEHHLRSDSGIDLVHNPIASKGVPGQPQSYVMPDPAETPPPTPQKTHPVSVPTIQKQSSVITPPTSPQEVQCGREKTKLICPVIHVQKRINGLRGFLTRTYQLHDILMSRTLISPLGLFTATDGTGQPKAVLKVLITAAQDSRHFTFYWKRQNPSAKRNRAYDVAKFALVPDDLVKTELATWVRQQQGLVSVKYHQHALLLIPSSISAITDIRESYLERKLANLHCL
ncbi:hypothetical protein DFQ28_008075 [Apophysomyces sp. BC1034]|nr:hypothetical protein DFQ30_004281 [Apophysomyces sp. BC1015]KAG0176808.1 hypothetical protein DFQ29_005601 [Apophysomyces sp. BC1021]KAG0186276.1 hypothetical protein DFQ28_008075 [Apophysomyces sp. BC1034]